MKYFILFFFASSILFSQNFQSEIETEEIEDHIVIKGMFYNHSDSSVKFSYEMNTIKSGRSGSSSTKQSGDFTAEPDEKVFLSKVILNKENSDYQIKLLIFDNKNVIAQDSVMLNSYTQGAK